MKVYLGKYYGDKSYPVYWDSEKIVNAHMIIAGKSGTGKTYRIRDILNQLVKQADPSKLRIHILDIHGDIDIEGASVVKFSEQTRYGFNPLVINPDPDFGGVRKRIQSFISTLGRTGHRLGSKQENVLRNILQEVYYANGFRDDDNSTWVIQKGSNRKNPTLEDVLRYANYKLKGMFLGTSSRCISTLEKLNKTQAKINNKIKFAKNNEYDKSLIEETQSEIDALKDQALEQFKTYLDSINTGSELKDLLTYDSKDVLKSVVDKLDNLYNIGIFTRNIPPFDLKNPLWRYDLRALGKNEKTLFVSFLLENIFKMAVQRGEQNDVREIVIIDEAHLFITDDEDNPINTIAKEARKFGLGIIAASQSVTHFSVDFLSNVATKIILGLDEMFWNSAANQLKIPEQKLKDIIPHKNLLVQMVNKGSSRSGFLLLKSGD